jgi:hypothetical protein
LIASRWRAGAPTIRDVIAGQRQARGEVARRFEPAPKTANPHHLKPLRSALHGCEPTRHGTNTIAVAHCQASAEHIRNVTIELNAVVVRP